VPDPVELLLARIRAAHARQDLRAVIDDRTRR
jgi:hypothetical protein